MSNYFTSAYFNINTGRLAEEQRCKHELRPKGNFKHVLVQESRLGKVRREVRRQFLEEAKDMRASWYIDLMHNLKMPPTALSKMLITQFTPMLIRHGKSRLVWRELMLYNHYPKDFNTPKNWRTSYDL